LGMGRAMFTWLGNDNVIMDREEQANLWVAKK